MPESIYSKLYDLTEKNMTSDAPQKLHSKKITEFYAQMNPDETDILDLMKLDASNDEFVQMAFIAFFNRLIDDAAYENWKNSFSLSKEKFRKKVIKTLSSSDEIRMLNKKIYNNIYSEGGSINEIFAKPNPALEKAFKIYRKLPEPIKKIVRKARGLS